MDEPRTLKIRRLAGRTIEAIKHLAAHDGITLKPSAARLLVHLETQAEHLSDAVDKLPVTWRCARAPSKFAAELDTWIDGSGLAHVFFRGEFHPVVPGDEPLDAIAREVNGLVYLMRGTHEDPDGNFEADYEQHTPGETCGLLR